MEIASAPMVRSVFEVSIDVSKKSSLPTIRLTAVGESVEETSALAVEDHVEGHARASQKMTARKKFLRKRISKKMG
jgi:hypothetical protein